MAADNIIPRATAVLEATDDNVVGAYLFGSVARGTPSAASDIDVAILLREPDRDGLMGIRFALERALEEATGMTAQVVVLNQAPPDLIHRVLRDGRILIDRDRAFRIRFEVRSRNEYFDLLPILNRYRKREAATP